MDILRGLWFSLPKHLTEFNLDLIWIELEMSYVSRSVTYYIAGPQFPQL